MQFARLTKVVGAFGLAIACMLGMAACSCSSNQASSGGVAAVVNGVEIPEQEVTDQIQSIRESSNLGDDEQWALFLAMQGITPAEVREQVIDGLVSQQLVKQGAQELGITVDSSEVDGYVDEMKASYDSDEAWAEALERVGFTEESYRQTIEDSLLQQKVGEYFEEHSEVTDEDRLTAAQTYLPMYDGAKRSSHILIMVDEDTDQDAAEARAREILDEINSGSIDFAEAARQYSEDTGSAQNGGDVGWDMTSSFVTEYNDALADLELDQVSEPFTTDYGVHIVKVTDVFNAPEKITSLDQVPDGFMDMIDQVAAMTSANNEYTKWVDSLKENAEITVNEMPAGLPYDVDLSAYQSSSTAADEAASESAAAEGSESAANAEGEAAEGEEGATADEGATAEGEAADADAEGEGAEGDAADEAADAEGADGQSSSSSSSEPEQN